MFAARGRKHPSIRLPGRMRMVFRGYAANVKVMSRDCLCKGQVMARAGRRVPPSRDLVLNRMLGVEQSFALGDSPLGTTPQRKGFERAAPRD